MLHPFYTALPLFLSLQLVTAGLAPVGAFLRQSKPASPGAKPLLSTLLVRETGYSCCNDSAGGCVFYSIVRVNGLR
jgi:hypothetical protein